MLFIKPALALSLAIVALAAPAIQPRQVDGLLSGIESTVDDILFGVGATVSGRAQPRQLDGIVDDLDSLLGDVLDVVGTTV